MSLPLQRPEGGDGQGVPKSDADVPVQPRVSKDVQDAGTGAPEPQAEEKANEEDERNKRTINMYSGFYWPEAHDSHAEVLPLSTFLEKSRKKKAQAEAEKKVKLGTMLGVYLPTMQNIFGVIMFLRLHWIVGVAGLPEGFFIVLLSCLVTLATSISLSAIATNGLVEEGGPYYVISRNLSPEFGAAIGILFFIANAVATSMYAVGFVEVLLKYVAPDLPQFGEPGSRTIADMHNTFRVYSSLVLLVFFVIVSFGVKFTQLFAPISLICVFVSIGANFVGAFMAKESNSPLICMLGDRLLKKAVLGSGNITSTCQKTENGSLWNLYCSLNTTTNVSYCDPYFTNNEVRVIPGVPGFSAELFSSNSRSNYMLAGEVLPGVVGNAAAEVVQDITTTFFELLAIHFPAVTGILTGCNMSGDLKDVRKSLPAGTIGAQLTTSFVFLSYVFLYGGVVEGVLLRDKYGEALGGAMVSSQFSWPTPWLMVVGCLGSTFGAGLQSVLCAPRLLQSVAKDDLIPHLSFFSKVTSRNEPFRALLLTVFIGEAAILIGAIDRIAPVVDFFFLMCYCFINIVCAVQTLLHFPNWRPTFRYYHWGIAVFGAVLSLFIMFATYWYYAILVIAACLFISKYVQYKGAKKEWGYGIQGLALASAQLSLLKANENELHPKNWRPQLLLMCKLNSQYKMDDPDLLTFASHLQAGRGLTLLISFIEADSSKLSVRTHAKKIQHELKALMDRTNVAGFASVIPVHDIAEAATAYILGSGIGGLRPNTVVIGWPAQLDRKNDFTYRSLLYALHAGATMEKCLLMLRGKMPTERQKVSGNVDVWWIMHDGGILILLPFLLKQHQVWSNCQIRVFAVAREKDNVKEMKQELETFLYQLRISASVSVVQFSDDTVIPFARSKTLLTRKKTRWISRLHLPVKAVSKAIKSPEVIENEVTEPSDSSVKSYTLSSDVLLDLESTTFSSEDQSCSQSSQSGSFSLENGQKRVGDQENDEELLWKQILMADPNLKTALQLNAIIYEQSFNSVMVVINLPSAPGTLDNVTMYMDYIEIMINGLKLVLMVRGSGREVISIY